MTESSPRARALIALDGLSLGDAFGQHVFRGPESPAQTLAQRLAPPAPWRHSDDTAMACVLVDHLSAHPALDQDALAREFARRYRDDPSRGYGAVACWVLARIDEGNPWREVSRTPYGGRGSMGNGAAMRVAPLAAWFAHNLPEALRMASLAAEVTHAHPEGIAGALAVTAASVFAWRARNDPSAMRPLRLLTFAEEHTPEGSVRDGLRRAKRWLDTTPEVAARALGDGSEVTAPDTVPFALWCAATGLRDYETALWRCATGCTAPDADVDTLCAIVGGIVSLAVGRQNLPAKWLQAREPLALG